MSDYRQRWKARKAEENSGAPSLANKLIDQCHGDKRKARSIAWKRHYDSSDRSTEEKWRGVALFIEEIM